MARSSTRRSTDGEATDSSARSDRRPGRRSGRSRSSGARCARSASAASARRTRCPTGPRSAGMIAKVPHLVEGRRGLIMKIHDLKPAPGSNQPRHPGRAGHRRPRRQDGRPRHQGPRRPRHRSQMNFEGGQMPLHMRVPEAQGVQEPVPRRVPGHQPRRHRGGRASTRSPRSSSTRKGLTHKGALVKVLGRGELTRKVTVPGPRLLEVGRKRHHCGRR